MEGFPIRGKGFDMSPDSIRDEQLKKQLKRAATMAAFVIASGAGVGVVRWSRRGKYEANNPPRVIEQPERIEVDVELMPGDDPNVILRVSTGGEEIEAYPDAIEYGPELCQNMILRAQTLSQSLATDRASISRVGMHIQYMKEALDKGVIGTDDRQEVREALSNLEAAHRLAPFISPDDSDID